jgi:hypothetical protein
MSEKKKRWSALADDFRTFLWASIQGAQVDAAVVGVMTMFLRLPLRVKFEVESALDGDKFLQN